MIGPAYPPHIHQCTLTGHDPVKVVYMCFPWTTSERRWTLQTWEHPTGAAVCKVLRLSNPLVADWLLSNSIKSSRLPLFPVSSINFDVLNLLRNTSDVPWWKDNPCSLHLSAVIILFQISVERQMAPSNSSCCALLTEAALKEIQNSLWGKKMIGPLKVDFVVNKRGKIYWGKVPKLHSNNTEFTIQVIAVSILIYSFTIKKRHLSCCSLFFPDWFVSSDKSTILIWFRNLGIS